MKKFLLISYENESRVSWPIKGLMYIASVLEAEGHYVENYPQDQMHYSEKHLYYYLENNDFDYVCLSFCGGYYQYNRLKKIMEAINSLKKRPIVLAGGHMFSPEPEYFLKKFKIDFIFIGEGIESIKNFCSRSHNTDGVQFLGIDGELNHDYTPIKPVKDVDSIPYPAWHLYPMDYYALIRPPKAENTDRVFSIISSYGCYGKCNFCYRLEKGMRLRSTESVVGEMFALNVQYGINYFFFDDELFIVSEKRAVELAEEILKSSMEIKFWCNGRVDRITENVLKKLKEAGCVFINYGIESYDDYFLKLMRKNITTDQIDFAVQKTLEAGISPGLNIIFGQPGETFDVLHRGAEYIEKHSDLAQLRTISPVIPYPGSPLYYYAIKQGLLKGVEDFYETKHKNSDLVTVNFTNYTSDELSSELFRVNSDLLEYYHVKTLEKQKEQLKRLYFGDGYFRGFRNT